MGNFSIHKNVNGKYAATDVRHYDPMLILGDIYEGRVSFDDADAHQNRPSK